MGYTLAGKACGHEAGLAMQIPFYILIRPIVYLAAVILFWQTARRKVESRWHFVAIVVGLFAISAALSVYEGVQHGDQIIPIGERQIPYEVARGFLDNISLFAIVGSLLMLLRRKLETARREVRQLARIASSSADAIASIDGKGSITSWNLGAEMVFGFSGEEMKGQRIKRLLVDDDWEKFSRGVERCLAEGFVRGLVCRVLGKGRREMLVEITLSAITDEEGKTRGVSFFMRDITEQKETEEELLYASRMAAVGTLASSVVGEFANLLTVISGKAQLGHRDAESPGAREAFDTIQSCALRAKNVTNNLLACARRQPPRKTLGQVADAADTALNSLEQEIEEARINVMRDYREVPDTAFDREQMTQAFANLILNALQSLRGEGGNLGIGIHSRQNFIEVTLMDDGPSIPRDALAHAFEPFAAPADDTQVRNTGLGLYVCREIVKYHSGNISVQSDDRTTTVLIHLPVSATVHQPLTVEHPAAHKDQCRIAVVDADGMIRDLLAQVLESRGFRVHTFPNPSTAGAADVASDFDVVIVDVSERTPNGGQFIEYLKQKGDVSVVALVGEAIGADELKKMTDGLAGCLRKPFGLDEINELCRALAPQVGEDDAPAYARYGI
jgi:PAS domain S-box-containing protein